MGDCCRHSHQDILSYLAIKIHKERIMKLYREEITWES